jgi:hypothetical protein
MALSWDVSKVKDCDTVCFEASPEGGGRRLTQDVHYIIMSSMACGLRGITEKNWKEFYVRVAVLEYLSDTPDNQRTSPELIRSLIGLTVNVGDETRAKWCARIARSHMERMVSHAEDELRRSPQKKEVV